MRRGFKLLSGCDARRRKRMSVHESSTRLSADGTASVCSETRRNDQAKQKFFAVLSEVTAAEHPTVTGGRLGACLYSSFVFPAGLWAVGAVDAMNAAMIAAVSTLVVTRPIMLMGGTRIAGVLVLEIAIAALAFCSVFPVLLGLPLAAFFPLLGMLACVSAGQAAVGRFVEDDRPQEAEVVIARATQDNVVDIRAAGIARRATASAHDRAVSQPSKVATESRNRAR